jgi:predicted 3-demethylubiquinone-9 3-methyltransferase (glyoxalase superfamily)
MSTTFQLDGQEFYALNGGPLFTFTPAISFFIHCETQTEIDDFWDKLSARGTQERCGWLKDKFGVSWQVVSSILSKLLQNPDPEESKSVMAAMLQMKKLDIKGLQRAADGA